MTLAIALIVAVLMGLLLATLAGIINILNFLSKGRIKDFIINSFKD